MRDVIEALNEMLQEHWIKVLTAAGFTVIGWILAHWRATRAWRRREFLGRVNISLNSITDGTLRIRTLSEESCTEVFLNDYAVQQLTRLMNKTTPADPVVPVPQEDCWYFLNPVLNHLSEQFATGLIAREAGQTVSSTQFLICLTNECDGDLRTRKLRAMVIRRDLLLDLPQETPRFESPHHAVRWKTLQLLSERYRKEPWRFLDVELVV